MKFFNDCLCIISWSIDYDTIEVTSKLSIIMCPARLNTQSFVKKAQTVHGDRYGYSLADYVHSYTKVTIVCLKHGDFTQAPKNHLEGQGCAKCGHSRSGGGNRFNVADFIKKAQSVHGDLYDYSLVEYVNNSTKVKIICPDHGEFLQQPNNHLVGNGCCKCGTARTANAKKYDTEEFVRRARLAHGITYDYSEVVYVHNLSRVEIICKTHGVFRQTPDKHIQGNGCQKCGIEKNSGKTHYKWDLRFTEEERKLRRKFYSQSTTIWRKSVFGRDDFTCQKCGDNKGGYLNAHHILPWSKFPEARFDVDNGVTLCRSCHWNYHRLYNLDKCDRASMNAYLISNPVREVALSV